MTKQDMLCLRGDSAIVFGYSKTTYESSTKAMNADLFKATSNSNDTGYTNMNRVCSVQFGEIGKGRDFGTASKLADPTGEMDKYAAKLNIYAKQMLRQTSITLGNDKTNYTSSTKEAIEWDAEKAKESIALRNETRKRTGQKPTTVIVGNEILEYITESKYNYNNKRTDFKASNMDSAAKNDLRSSHFSFQGPTLDYSTSNNMPCLTPEEFAMYSKPVKPLHDLKKSTVEIV